MLDLDRPDLKKILKNEFIRMQNCFFFKLINDKSLLQYVILKHTNYHVGFQMKEKMLKLMNTYIYIFHRYNKTPLGILLKSLDNLHG